MTLQRVRAYALAGADAVSVGVLTHSVIAADIALELEPDE
jgi:nicotinate-nucleotide pyrophosphorylase